MDILKLKDSIDKLYDIIIKFIENETVEVEDAILVNFEIFIGTLMLLCKNDVSDLLDKFYHFFKKKGIKGKNGEILFYLIERLQTLETQQDWNDNDNIIKKINEVIDKFKVEKEFEQLAILDSEEQTKNEPSQKVETEKSVQPVPTPKNPDSSAQKIAKPMAAKLSETKGNIPAAKPDVPGLKPVEGSTVGNNAPTSVQTKTLPKQDYSNQLDTWNKEDYMDVLEDFLTEATEILERLDQELMKLEQTPTDPDLITSIFRAMHTLKGNSATINLKVLNLVAHTSENVLDRVRNDEITVDESVLNVLFDTLNYFENILDNIKSDQDPNIDINNIMYDLKCIMEDIPLGDKSTESESSSVQPAGEFDSPEPEDKEPASEVNIEKKDYSVEFEKWDKSEHAEILESFITEADEIINRLDESIMKAEQDLENLDLVNGIFRDLHTLKGNSGALKLKIMNILAHKAETVLDKVRNNKLKLNSDIIDVLLETLSSFENVLNNLKDDKTPNVNINDIMYKLELIDTGNIAALNSVPESTPAAGNETDKADRGNSSSTEPVKSQTKTPDNKNTTGSANTKTPAKKTETVKSTKIRIDLDKLDNIVNLIGEIVIDKIKLKQKIDGFHDVVVLLNNILNVLDENLHKHRERNFSLNVNDEFLDYDKRLILDSDLYSLYNKDLKIIRDAINSFCSKLPELKFSEDTIDLNNWYKELNRINHIFGDNINELKILSEHFNLVSSELQDSIMEMRMVPLAELFDKMPRQIRGLAKKLNKKVNLDIIGKETEMDKTVIEQLSDPFIHLIRNSLDHGIENPEERTASGKPPAGHLEIVSKHEGNQVVITIKDDGKGIDEEIILRKAVEKGLLTPEQKEQLTKTEIFDLLFMPGFSSAEKVTKVSGRGVGMDVVKSSINDLKGTVEIDSVLGEGTTITLRLPLTIAVMQVQLIKCGIQTFAIPTSFIEEIIPVDTKAIKKIGQKSVIDLRGDIIPIVMLSDIINIKNDMTFGDENIELLIIKVGEKKIGFVINDTVRQQEVVIKNLGYIIRNVKHVSGATILGEGEIVLILNVLSIVKEAKNVTARNYDIFKNMESSGQTQTKQKNVEQLEVVSKKKILVVDDSQTIRKKLTDILMFEGYSVETADNGKEGLDLAEKNNYDLFTIDINMPLMNGYELTENIRRLDKYHKTPILMITSKIKKIDKLRGLDAGADDYISKPFDEDELADIVEKYISN